MRIAVGCDIAHYTRSIGQFDNRMSYLVCLEQLGHEVVLFADVYPERCIDDDYKVVGFDSWHGRKEFTELVSDYPVDIPHCLIYDGGRETDGLTFDDAVAVAESCDVLLNIGGKLQTETIRDRIGSKVFLDLAPGKTQVYHERYGLHEELSAHDFFFTVGLEVADGSSDIPTGGFPWRGFVHPVPLTLWPVASQTPERFTTITGWQGKETFVYEGRYSGEKSDEWREFIDLPTRAGVPVEIAARMGPGFEAEKQTFVDHGWTISDPLGLRSLSAYRDFIARSQGEFTIANPRYTRFRSGWFSERSARYLASGRPVIMQSTGIEDHLPEGKGLLTFETIDEAVAAIESVSSNYEIHRDAARALAETHFDGRTVLKEMLEVVS